MSSDLQISAYEEGAAQSLATQRVLEAAGLHEAAKVAAESVNANLDSILTLKQGQPR